MKLTWEIEIDLDNDSFQEDSGNEIASLFREIQLKFQGELPPIGMAQALHDINGNTVGKFLIKEDTVAKINLPPLKSSSAVTVNPPIAHDTNGNTVCNCLHLKKSTCSEIANDW